MDSTSQDSTLVNLSLVSVSYSQPHVLKRHSKGYPEANGEDGEDGAALTDSSTMVASLFSTGKEVCSDSEAQSCVSRTREETLCSYQGRTFALGGSESLIVRHSDGVIGDDVEEIPIPHWSLT